MDSYRVSTVDVPESPIASADVRDSSGVTPCIVMKNDGVLYHQESSFSPESMRFRYYSLIANNKTRTVKPNIYSIAGSLFSPEEKSQREL